MKKLTDEDILKVWNAANGKAREFGHAVIAKFCEVNGLAEQVKGQEPVAWAVTYKGAVTRNVFENRASAQACCDALNLTHPKDAREVVPLYTTPLAQPAREWVGLTEEEAAECWNTSTVQTWKNIESKLREKNAGQPAREWVGLGQLEISAGAIEMRCGIANGEFPDVAFNNGARWAESRLREKNAGQPAAKGETK